MPRGFSHNYSIPVQMKQWKSEGTVYVHTCMRRSSILVMFDYSSVNVKAVAAVLASCCDYLFSHHIRHPLSSHGLAAPLVVIHSRYIYMYMGQLRHARKKEHWWYKYARAPANDSRVDVATTYSDTVTHIGKVMMASLFPDRVLNDFHRLHDVIITHRVWWWHVNWLVVKA